MPTTRSRPRIARLTASLVAAAAAFVVGATSASAQPASPAPALDARTATLYLTQRAPAGSVVGGYVGQQSEDSIYSSYRLDRGAGPVQLDLNVQRDLFTPAEAEQFYRCDRDRYRTCSVKTDVDGSYLLRATRVLPRGGTAVEVDLLRGDGTRVLVLSGNTADAKYGGAVHGRGVTVKAATSIAQDEVWQLHVRPPASDVREAKRVIRPWTLLG